MTVLLLDLQVAARSLAQHSKRSLFLGAAVAAVTAALVLLGGLFGGIRAAMLESGTMLSTGHVNVGGFFKPTSGSSAPLVTGWRKVLEDTKRIVPELQDYTVRTRRFARAISEASSMQLALAGIDVAREPRLQESLQLAAGSLDALTEPSTILIFEDQARRLEVGIGDVLTLAAPTDRGANNTADVRVVAIAKSVGILSAMTAFMPDAGVRKLYQLAPDTTGVIHLFLANERLAGPVAERLRKGLAAAGYRVMDPDPQPYWMKLFAKVNAEDWTGQKLDVTIWEDELAFLAWVLKALGGLGGALLLVLVGIVVIGILNTLAIAIRERTREIGTLRAIGMQRRKVLWLFLLEMTLLGLLGSTAGALVAASISGAVNAARIPVPEAALLFIMQDRWRILVTPGALLSSAAFITAVTALAALYPAFQASRLAPITAIHHVG
jgi:ABC-type lipoprotein release transport system permease subunit